MFFAKCLVTRCRFIICFFYMFHNMIVHGCKERNISGNIFFVFFIFFTVYFYFKLFLFFSLFLLFFLFFSKIISSTRKHFFHDISFVSHFRQSLNFFHNGYFVFLFHYEIIPRLLKCMSIIVLMQFGKAY